MKQHRLVLTMAASVLTPFAVLSSVAMWEMDRNARSDIERTIGGQVDACLAAVEKEIGRHAAVLQTLGSVMDGDLTHLRGHAEGVFRTMAPDWMTIVLAQRERQLFNLRLKPGAPLPPSRDPVANQRVVETQRVEVTGVAVEYARLREPFISIRAPVILPDGGATPYTLVAAVRAWTITQTVKACKVPVPNWRIGVVDADLRIVGRSGSTDPNDERIGRLSTESYRDGLRSGQRFFFATSTDGDAIFAGVAVSERYGWALSLVLPEHEVHDAIARVWLLTGGTALGGLLVAALTCVMSLRTYGRLATTERLRASLLEKDTLLREIHHRVKNNLQSIWGMMRFERSRITDSYARERMEVIQARILALGSIHQQLYEGDNLSSIDFARHLREVTDRVRESLDPERITLHLTAERLRCDLETALPLGLIMAELVSNAVKHAFPGERRGTIRVSFKRHEDGDIRLGVFDDGQGFTNNKPGIGQMLIDLLAAQIEAQVSVTYPSGCHACITVPGRLFE